MLSQPGRLHKVVVEGPESRRPLMRGSPSSLSRRIFTIRVLAFPRKRPYNAWLWIRPAPIVPGPLRRIVSGNGSALPGAGICTLVKSAVKRYGC